MKQRLFKWMKRIFFGLLILIVALLIAGYTYESISRKNVKKKFPPPGQLVDIGTHKLHFRISGSGNETIVFDAGSGEQGSYGFLMLEEELGKHATLISYDRAGINWSEPGPAERNGVRIADELYAALQKLAIKGPVVLVGHSQGGLHMIQFAKKYRSMVKALVLMDAPLPSSFNDMPQELKNVMGGSSSQMKMATFMANFGVMRLTAPPPQPAPFKINGLNTDSIEQVIADMLPATLVNGVFPEVEHSVMKNDIVVNDGMLESLPVRIISSRSFIRSVNEGPPGWNETLQQKFVDYWERNQSALVKLSANSKRIILDSSGHAMHVTQPAVVIETILSVTLDQIPE